MWILLFNIGWPLVLHHTFMYKFHENLSVGLKLIIWKYIHFYGKEPNVKYFYMKGAELICSCYS